MTLANLVRIATLILVGVIAERANGQLPPTIPERLAATGRDTGVSWLVGSGAPPTVAELLQRADRVVMGTIGRAHSYLSPDQRQVLTDYEVTRPIVLFDVETPGSPVPGAIKPITVTQLGGTVLVGDLRFTELHETLPPLESGSDVILLLNRVGEKYRIARDFYGIFRVLSGTVTPLAKTTDFAEDYRGISVAEAQQRMIAVLNARKPAP